MNEANKIETDETEIGFQENCWSIPIKKIGVMTF